MIPPKPSNPDRLVPAFPEWEIHVGNIHLFIVGPGPDAMRKCSRRSVNPGTPTEWEIARKAVSILNLRHRETNDAGEAEILAALIECGYEEEV